jgi:hypothetical protein
VDAQRVIELVRALDIRHVRGVRDRNLRSGWRGASTCPATTSDP